MQHVFLSLAGAVVLVAACSAAVAAPQKVILDTDIGDDIDDAYALVLLCSLPDVDLLGVTTTYGETDKRAILAAKLLSVLGRTKVPVCAGRKGASPIGRQFEWARGYHSSSIRSESAEDFLYRQIERFPGEVTLIGIGALTNFGDLLAQHPDVKGKIKRIVIMGGSVRVGYSLDSPPVSEWNIKCDPKAAQAVYTSGVPLAMAGLEVTTMMQLDAERQKRLFAHGTPVTDALAALTNLWGNATPTLFDPVAVAYALGHSFSKEERDYVVVGDDGTTRIAEGTPNATVLIDPRKDAFLDWYVGAIPASSGR